jgi:hypothetical protein
MSSKNLVKPRRAVSALCLAWRRASASRARSSAPGSVRCPRISPLRAARAMGALAALTSPALSSRPGASPRPRIAARGPPPPSMSVPSPSSSTSAADGFPSVASASAPASRAGASPDAADDPSPSTGTGLCVATSLVPPPHPRCGRYNQAGGRIQIGEPDVCVGCCLRRLAGRGELPPSRCARRSGRRVAGRALFAGLSPPVGSRALAPLLTRSARLM